MGIGVFFFFSGIMLNYFATSVKLNIMGFFFWVDTRPYVAISASFSWVFSSKKVNNSLLIDIYPGDNSNLAENRLPWGEF